MLAARAIARRRRRRRRRRPLPRRRRPRARRRPAVRGAAPARAARPARRACRDPRRRPHAVDPPQLRPLDVRGLSRVPLLLTPRRWHRGMFTGRRLHGGLTPYTRRDGRHRHWLTAPHWSSDIPLDTPHPRLDALAEHGFVRAARSRRPDPRVRVPRPRVHGLEERRRHQLRADRHRRRRARLPRLLEAGRRAPRQGRPLHVERRSTARRIVADVESVGADFGRVRVIKLEPQDHDDGAAPDPPRRQQPLQPRRPTAGSCARGSSSPTTPTATCC